MTISDLAVALGVGAALKEHADLILGRLTEDQRRDARGLFIHLVRPDDLSGGRDEESARDLKRIAAREDLTDTQWRLAQHLAGTRLVATTGGEAIDTATAELAHESLIVAWPQLNWWVNETRTFRVWQERLRTNLHRWRSAARRTERRRALLQGRELREAVRKVGEARRGGYEIPAHERAYIHLSRLRRRNVRTRIAAAATAVAVLLTVVTVQLVDVAVQQRRTEAMQARTTIAQRLMAQAEALRGSDIRKALKLGLAAQRIHPGAATTSGLYTTVVGTPLIATLTMPGYSSDTHSVAFSPHRDLIATSVGDIWSIADRHHPIRTARIPGGFGLAFSPNGDILAVGGRAPMLWDLTNPSAPVLLATLSGHTESLAAIAFSPDGRTLATGSGDHTTALWNITDPRNPTRLASLTEQKEVVVAVKFSPDRKTFATASEDGTAILWDITNLRQPERLATVPTRTGMVYGAADFSPDGRLFAVADLNTATVWDLGDRRHPVQVAALTGHLSRVSASPSARMATSWRRRAGIEPRSCGISATRAGHSRPPRFPGRP